MSNNKQNNNTTNTNNTNDTNDTNNTNDINDTNDDNIGDYMFISRKHFDRKKQVESGQMSGISSSLQNIGPIGGFMIVIFDIIAGFIARFLVSVLRIASYAFDWVMGLVFGNYSGLMPSYGKSGSMYTMRNIRYFITILYPPFGVFLNKGIYGWFNIFITFILCYIHYVIGIIYAFVICSRNRYADLYENTLINQYKKENPSNPIPNAKDYSALLSSVVFLIILIGLIFTFIKLV